MRGYISPISFLELAKGELKGRKELVVVVSAEVVRSPPTECQNCFILEVHLVQAKPSVNWLVAYSR